MNKPVTPKDIEVWLIGDAFDGSIDGARHWLDEGVDIDAVDPVTGLSPLHVAIGRNHTNLVRFLLDRGATIKPDASGRWPSTIAELCEADGEICDMIVDAEAKLGIV